MGYLVPRAHGMQCSVQRLLAESFLRPGSGQSRKEKIELNNVAGHVGVYATRTVLQGSFRMDHARRPAPAARAPKSSGDAYRRLDHHPHCFTLPRRTSTQALAVGQHHFSESAKRNEQAWKCGILLINEPHMRLRSSILPRWDVEHWVNCCRCVAV